MQQRQLLRSPIHKNGVTTTNTLHVSSETEEEEEEKEDMKLIQTDRRIHLIPLLSLLCFLILYLASHDPSSSIPSDPELDMLLDASSSSTELNKRNFIQIRSLRNLQEEGSEAVVAKKPPPIRKLCDF